MGISLLCPLGQKTDIQQVVWEAIQAVLSNDMAMLKAIVDVTPAVASDDYGLPTPYISRSGRDGCPWSSFFWTEGHH